MPQSSLRAPVVRRASAVLGLAVFTVLGAGAARASSGASVEPSSASAPVAVADFALRGELDSLTGISGKLRARFIAPDAAAGLPLLTRLFGDSSAIPYYLMAIGYRLRPWTQTGSNFGMTVKHAFAMRRVNFSP